MQAVEALSIGEEANLCKTAVVFCTHYFDPGISARLDKLREDIARRRGLAEVHLLTETATQVPACFEPIQTRFDYRKYSAGFDGLIGERVVPGNAHLPALFFMEAHPEYEYYWFIEYDVIFGGRWDRLLNDLREDPADLLATHVRALDTDDSWYWTHTLKCGNKKIEGCPQPRGFLANIPGEQSRSKRRP